MKRWVILFVGLTLILIGCVSTQKQLKTAKKAPKKMATHPELSAQEKLIACSQCHMKVTPEIYKEWFSSTHGIANVKCFQCHGTFEDFHVEPQIKTCEACHSKEVEKTVKGRSCWDCHPEHYFTVHK